VLCRCGDICFDHYVVILRSFKYVKIKITISALVVGVHIEISITGITI